MYFASSPRQFCPPNRTEDLVALLSVINNAQEYSVYFVSVSSRIQFQVFTDTLNVSLFWDFFVNIWQIVCRFILVSVMDYSPTTLYQKPNSYWPLIDDALRTAAFWFVFNQLNFLLFLLTLCFLLFVMTVAMSKFDWCFHCGIIQFRGLYHLCLLLLNSIMSKFVSSKCPVFFFLFFFSCLLILILQIYYIYQIYQIKNKYLTLEWIIQSIWSLKNKSTLELRTGLFLTLSFIHFCPFLFFFFLSCWLQTEEFVFRSADYFEWTAGLSVVWSNEKIVRSMKEIFYRDWDSQYIIKVNRTLPPLEILMKYVP